MQINAFDGWPSMEALAAQQTNAEASVSQLNKIAADLMVEEMQTILNEMRELAKDPQRNWPELARAAASIRGYAFNAFRICSDMRRREAPPQRQVFRPTSVADLL